jgi:hypothetical protein
MPYAASGSNRNRKREDNNELVQIKIILKSISKIYQVIQYNLG